MARRKSGLGQLRRVLYLTQRTIGDVEAARRDPAVLAKRLIRRRERRLVGRVLSRWGL
jgi:hypothetical protein